MSTTLFHALSWLVGLGVAGALVLGAAGTAYSLGTTYYVSGAGDDNNPGTAPTTPLATIDKINVMTFRPGDQILFHGGSTFRGSMYFDEGGTAAEPITIGSYGTGRATIDAGTRPGIFVYNKGGYRIRDLIVVSPDRVRSGGSSGIIFYNDLPGNTKLSSVHIDNVKVSGFGTYGIGIIGEARDATKSGYRDVRVTNSELHDNGHAGFSTSGYWDPASTGYANANVYVARNRVHGNPGVPGFARHSGDGILLYDVDGGTIEHNVVYDNGALSDGAIGGPFGIWTMEANNILIQFNESHHNRTNGPHDGGGFDLDGGTTNSTVQYNYSHDNDGTGFLLFRYAGAPKQTGNNVVRYNVSQNDGRKNRSYSLAVDGTMDFPVEIYNNTIFTSPSASTRSGVFVGVPNVRVRNNIVVGSGDVSLVEGQAGGSPQTLFQGNNYWNTSSAVKILWGPTPYTSLAAWRAATGQEMLGSVETGYSVDPLLQNAGGGETIDDPDRLGNLTAYQLTARSPMKNAGLDLSSRFGVDIGTRDFYGTTIPQGGGYDVGAHELPVSAAPRPPSVPWSGGPVDGAQAPCRRRRFRSLTRRNRRAICRVVSEHLR